MPQLAIDAIVLIYHEFGQNFTHVVAGKCKKSKYTTTKFINSQNLAQNSCSTNIFLDRIDENK